MRVSGLDFRNPVGIETFNCFKKVCVIERSTNEYSRSVPTPKDVQVTAAKIPVKSLRKVQQQVEEDSASDCEPTMYAVAGSNIKPWNHPAGFPCPMADHKHEVSKCAEFFALSPVDGWEQIDNGRMCFSFLKSKTVCKSRKCINHPNVPKALKCTLCASWAKSKGLALFSIFCFVNKRNMGILELLWLN